MHGNSFVFITCNHKLIKCSHRETSTYLLCFSVTASRLWNDLPLYTRVGDSLDRSDNISTYTYIFLEQHFEII